jgi:hypothetical protein
MEGLWPNWTKPIHHSVLPTGLSMTSQYLVPKLSGSQQSTELNKVCKIAGRWCRK